MKKAILGICCYIAIYCSHAQAVPIIDSITSCPAGGLTATAEWSDCGSVLISKVTDLGGEWQYDWDFGVRHKDVSHFIIGVSDNFTVDNILAGTTSGWELMIFGDQGNSNPGIPGSLYGLKWEFDDLLSVSATLISDLPPEWRDFYAVDGKTGDNIPYAYNTGWGTCEGHVGVVADRTNCAIGPNSGDIPPSRIPEPGTLGLAMLGLVGMTRLRNRRLRQ